jgi:hypothetical protein
MKFSKLLVPILFVAFLGLFPLCVAGQQEDHPAISAEELIAKLNKGEKVIILDLRSEGAYKSTNKKIKDDIRIDGDGDFDTKLKDVPRDSQIVAYCT